MKRRMLVRLCLQLALASLTACDDGVSPPKTRASPEPRVHAASPADGPRAAAPAPHVVVIGDSWMDQGQVGIIHSLRQASGKHYRSYAIAGRRLLGGPEAIPAMFDRACSADARIDTVIMNGGVNDIGQAPGMLAECEAGRPPCQQLYRALLERLSALWSRMAEAGVKDVVYVQYSDRDRVDYGFGLPDGDNIARRCRATPDTLRCHVLRTGDLAQGDLPDGLHPSAQAYDRLGRAIHDLMRARKMGR